MSDLCCIYMSPHYTWRYLGENPKIQKAQFPALLTRWRHLAFDFFSFRRFKFFLFYSHFFFLYPPFVDFSIFYLEKKKKTKPSKKPLEIEYLASNSTIITGRFGEIDAVLLFSHPTVPGLRLVAQSFLYSKMREG